MADVVMDLETDNTEELVNQGIKAFNLADYSTAATALSRAVELLAAEHGDKHDSLGIAYFYYGKALLEVYREEAEPLGDAVPREIDSDSDEDTVGETSETKETPNTDETTLNSATCEPPDKPSSVSKTDDQLVTNGDNSSSKTQDTSVEQEPTEQEPTDLQVAWEVLELAKMIFDQRGEPGKKELAETFILLGEISLESENFTSAVDDIKRGLEIQKTLVEADSRALAQTYYKLAVALSTDNQIDEAIQHFNVSLDILKNRVSKLKENAEVNNDEIEDIEGLIPEIEEKIADMKSFKEEAVNRLVAAIQAKPEPSAQFAAGSSTTSINDISHLIKRKRKSDEEDDKLVKKVSE